MPAVTHEQVISFLNEMLKIDSAAINCLFQLAILCDKELLKHPTVQIVQINDRTYLRTLGLLNGMFGTIESGRLKNFGFISMVCDKKDGTIIEFVETEKAKV
jgi:hypothetical protein